MGSESYDMDFSSFVPYRFANAIPFYGIFINLQYFGSNIFLFQVIFGILTASVRFAALLFLSHMDRRPTVMLFMCLLGLSILANMFVPQGERRQTLGERKRPFPILQGLQWSHLSEARSKDRSSLRAKYSFKPIWEFIRNFAAMFLGKELKVGEGKLRCIFIFITLH